MWYFCLYFYSPGLFRVRWLYGILVLLSWWWCYHVPTLFMWVLDTLCECEFGIERNVISIFRFIYMISALKKHFSNIWLVIAARLFPWTIWDMHYSIDIFHSVQFCSALMFFTCIFESIGNACLPFVTWMCDSNWAPCYFVSKGHIFAYLLAKCSIRLITLEKHGV